MKDINGQPLNPGDVAQLLCEVVSIDPNEGVRVRILNSEMELLVGCKHDEALGGYVADSELAKFVEVRQIEEAEVIGMEIPLSKPVVVNPYEPMEIPVVGQFRFSQAEC